MLAARVEGVRIWRVDDSSRRCVANLCDNEGHGRESEGETPQMGGRRIMYLKIQCSGLRWQNAACLGMVTSGKRSYVNRHVPARAVSCQV